ncbi:MAG: phosphoribosyl 1,2-cyclic phosphodiesterase [Desulforhopalus sp.]|jgi:phosphoribosyl 1,2-cyclic phosphodiesterase
MRFSVLGSGSRGNAVYIEAGDSAVLIDAGFSGKELQKRMHSVGRDLANVNALCITHEHHDHICGAGVISRRYEIPVVINDATLEAASPKIGKLFDTTIFSAGEIVSVGDLEIRSFRISHDTADPVGFVISDGNKCLGYLTDTGKVSHLMVQRLLSCHAAIIEFNHDLEMLKYGPYPLPLQQRVRSSRGHLSNDDAAEFLAELMGGAIKDIVLAHLSEKNNTVELARVAATRCLIQWPEVNLHIAGQDSALPLLQL